MSTTKHTPGPWHVEAEEWTDGQGILICCKDAGVALIDPDDEEGATPEDFANAHLIAAAPEMLEALKAFLRAPSIGSNGNGSVTIEVATFNLDAARAAIAKAEGK